MRKPTVSAGYLPETLKIFCRPGFEYEAINSEVRKQFIHIFVVNGAKEDATWKTGRDWAKDGYNYDPATRKTIKFDALPEIERDNRTPFTSVRLLSLEVRGNGGRAYQVCLDEKYLCDLREDVLLDCIANVGINAGGIITAEFVFARIGSQMKLLRKGSELYNQIAVLTTKTKTPAIKNLEVGGVYENSKGAKVYLGEVFTSTVAVNRMTPAQCKKEKLYLQSTSFSRPVPKLEVDQIFNERRYAFITLEAFNKALMGRLTEHLWYYAELLQTKPSSFRRKLDQSFTDKQVADVIAYLKENLSKKETAYRLNQLVQSFELAHIYDPTKEAPVILKSQFPQLTFK